MNKYYHVRRQGDDDYLQHWSLSGAHKYIAKIDLGGKFRYFYNQAEIEAYKAAKAAGKTINGAYKTVRRGIQDASRAANNTYKVVRKDAEDAGRQISLTARKAQKAVGRTINNVGREINNKVNGVKKAYKSYQNFKKLSPVAQKMAAEADRMGIKSAQGASTAEKLYRVERSITDTPKNIQKAVSDAGKTVSKAARDVSVAANRTVKKAEKVVGLTDRKILDKATSRSNSAWNDSTNHERGWTQAHKDEKTAAKTVERAQRNYNRTPLGRAEKAINDTRSNVRETVEDYRDTFNKKVKPAIARTGRDIDHTVNRAKNTVRNIVGDISAEANRNISRIRSLVASGKTYSQIAKQLGISPSQVAKLLKK